LKTWRENDCQWTNDVGRKSMNKDCWSQVNEHNVHRPPGNSFCALPSRQQLLCIDLRAASFAHWPPSNICLFIDVGPNRCVHWPATNNLCSSTSDQHRSSIDNHSPGQCTKAGAWRAMHKSCCLEVYEQKMLLGSQWSKRCLSEVDEQRMLIGGRWTNIIWSEVNEQKMLLGRQWTKWCWSNIDDRKLIIFIDEAYNQTICILW
jgi:hypothetical protein